MKTLPFEIFVSDRHSKTVRLVQSVATEAQAAKIVYARNRHEIGNGYRDRMDEPLSMWSYTQANEVRA